MKKLYRTTEVAVLNSIPRRFPTFKEVARMYKLTQTSALIALCGTLLSMGSSACASSSSGGPNSTDRISNNNTSNGIGRAHRNTIASRRAALQRQARIERVRRSSAFERLLRPELAIDGPSPSPDLRPILPPTPPELPNAESTNSEITEQKDNATRTLVDAYNENNENNENNRGRIFSAMNLCAGPNFDERIHVPTPMIDDIRFIFGWYTGLHRNRDDISDREVEQHLDRFESSMRTDSPSLPVMINIEHIPVENVRRHKGVSDEELQEGHDLLAGIADIVRERYPDSPIGYFDMLPPQHMHAWDPTDYQYPSYMETIQRADYRIDPVTGQRDESEGFLDHVDYIAPAFYLSEQRIRKFREERALGKPIENNIGAMMIDDWVRETTEAARSTGKPVIAVLWHREHDLGNGLRDEDGFCIQPYIGDEEFALMLETTLKYCDYVILWSGFERFDRNASWLDVLESFVNQAPSNRPSVAVKD